MFLIFNIILFTCIPLWPSPIPQRRPYSPRPCYRSNNRHFIRPGMYKFWNWEAYMSQVSPLRSIISSRFCPPRLPGSGWTSSPLGKLCKGSCWSLFPFACAQWKAVLSYCRWSISGYTCACICPSRFPLFLTTLPWKDPTNSQGFWNSGWNPITACSIFSGWACYYTVWNSPTLSCWPWWVRKSDHPGRKNCNAFLLQTTAHPDRHQNKKTHNVWKDRWRQTCSFLHLGTVMDRFRWYWQGIVTFGVALCWKLGYNVCRRWEHNHPECLLRLKGRNWRMQGLSADLVPYPSCTTLFLILL